MASKLSPKTKVTITLAEFKRLKEIEAKAQKEEPPPYATDEDEEEEEGGMCHRCGFEDVSWCMSNGCDDTQYKELCHECEITLGIDVPIMCYTNPDGSDVTLCNNCYWDNEYWGDDTNEDNEEAIEEYFWKVIEKLKKEPYYNGNIFESANMAEKLQKDDTYYNRHISHGLSEGWIEEESDDESEHADAMAYRYDVESRCPEGHRTVWNDKTGRFDYVPTDGAKVEEEPIICTECSRDFTEEVDGRSSFEEEGKVICIDCFSSLY